MVLGGGNIWRGSRAISQGMDAAQSHYMGMLATIINALALQDALERHGVFTRDDGDQDGRGCRAVYPAPRHPPPGERARDHPGRRHRQPVLHNRPAAALRAAEVQAEVVLMAKNGVDGVYSADPKRDSTATKFDRITYMDALSRGLTVMDSTALTFCKDNQIPIIVFDPMEPGNIQRIILGEQRRHAGDRCPASVACGRRRRIIGADGSPYAFDCCLSPACSAGHTSRPDVDGRPAPCPPDKENGNDQ